MNSTENPRNSEREARYAEAIYGEVVARCLGRSVRAGEETWPSNVRAVLAVANEELTALRAKVAAGADGP